MVTRFYFHNATNTTPNLPTAEQSSLTADTNAEGSQTTNRQMNTTIGTGMVGIVTTFATGTNEYYYTRFVSPPLFQADLDANTWTYNFAAHQNQTAANFPVSGSNQPVRVNCYVWRPGTGKIGTILDGNTASTVDEGGSAATLAHHVTFSGSSVASMQNNDVIVFEVWFIITPDASGRNGTFYYDGTTVNTTDNATVTNHASFLETPEDLILAGAELFERDVTADFTIESAVATRKRAIVSIPGSVEIQTSPVRILSANRTVTADPQVADAVARQIAVFRSIGESFELEVEAIGEKVFARVLLESYMIEDAAVRFLHATRAIPVPVELVDAVVRSKQVFISLAAEVIGPILDSVARARDVIRTLNETPSIDAPVVKVYSTTRSASGSFTIEDAVARLKRAIVPLPEPITIIDLAARKLTVFRSFAENIVFVESTQGVKIFFRSLSESLEVDAAMTKLYTAVKTAAESVIIDTVALGLTGPFLILRDAAATVEIGDVVAGIRRVPRLCMEAIAIVDAAINKLCIAYED